MTKQTDGAAAEQKQQHKSNRTREPNVETKPINQSTNKSTNIEPSLRNDGVSTFLRQVYKTFISIEHSFKAFVHLILVRWDSYLGQRPCTHYF